ncbi:hypothetical protein L218DRAFT_947615 [Marasmius fiardii PR-910]|nr:hypothetical protein L218DRAFT_947615 [Marasmius fiardii PR-910]
MFSFPFLPRTILDATAARAAFDGIIVALDHARLVSHIDVFNSTLLVYDVILNLALEIEHIWRRPWSSLTVLYIFQRYLPFFDTAVVTLHHDFGVNLSPSYCTVNYHVAAWCFMGGILLSEVLLTLRVWAVWERRTSVGVGFILFFFACWGTGCFFLARFLSAVKFAYPPFPIPNYHGCFLVNGSHAIYLCWVMWMVYDTGTLIMMLIPGVSAYRRGGRSELMRAVYRDGVMYYALIFLVSTTNVVVGLTLPVGPQYTPVSRPCPSSLIIRARTTLPLDKSRNPSYSSGRLAAFGCPNGSKIMGRSELRDYYVQFLKWRTLTYST